MSGLISEYFVYTWMTQPASPVQDCCPGKKPKGSDKLMNPQRANIKKENTKSNKPNSRFQISPCLIVCMSPALQLFHCCRYLLIQCRATQAEKVQIKE